MISTKTGRTSANSVMATPSSLLRSIRLTAVPPPEVSPHDAASAGLWWCRKSHHRHERRCSSSLDPLRPLVNVNGGGPSGRSRWGHRRDASRTYELGKVLTELPVD